MIAQAKFRSVQWMLVAVFALAPAAVFAQQGNASQDQKQQDKDRPEAAQGQTDEPAAKTGEEAKLKSVPGGKALGMSVLGNQEAPTSLVIVPWKSSELGNGLGISPMLDDSRLPIDKEVFMRMLNYYEIRSETPRASSAPADRNAAQPVTVAQRGKQ